MASEVEAKYWIKKPKKRICRALNLEDITDYSVRDLRKHARKITGSYPECHTLIDNIYTKTDMEQGYSADELEEKVSLRKVWSDNQTSYYVAYGKCVLSIAVEEGKDIEKEYKNFMMHLRTYFAGKDKETPKEEQPNKYALRIRRNNTTKTTYLTLKCKHGKADENSEEYEFIVPSRRAAERFVRALGYKQRPERTKTKHQEKYSMQDNGTTTHIEFNRIPGLGHTPLLEIEVVSHSLKTSPSIEYVFKVAERLGIKDTEKDTESGGNLELRGYGRLLKIANNGNNYKKH